MQLDTKALQRLNTQLRLVNKDISACRRCLRDLQRLRSVQALQAIAMNFDVAGLVEHVAPPLLEELQDAAKRLSKNVPQVIRAIDAFATTTEGTAPVTAAVQEE